MADNIMNDNAKDNNADNNVIEFDSKVTEKDLLRFKFYHKYHTISGMAETVSYTHLTLPTNSRV